MGSELEKYGIVGVTRNGYNKHHTKDNECKAMRNVPYSLFTGVQYMLSLSLTGVQGAA